MSFVSTLFTFLLFDVCCVFNLQVLTLRLCFALQQAASLRSAARPVFLARSLVASSSYVVSSRCSLPSQIRCSVDGRFALTLRPCTRTRTFARSLVAPAAAAPKIDAIVDSISTLTLLEAADLVSALKVRLL